MQELIKKINNITLKDSIKIEESDRQFISLKNLYFNIKNKDFYLPLIIANSLICYQLSSKWEDYWEEFSDYFSKNDIINLTKDLEIFIKQSKWNKRLINIKIKRLEKIKYFLDNFLKKELYYYENMSLLRDDLSQIMKQKKDSKTIVFSIKMYSYGARNYFWKNIYYPNDIDIPIDSRLENLYKKYNLNTDIKINDFYKILSEKTKIPPLHLDGILWTKYEELIK